MGVASNCYYCVALNYFEGIDKVAGMLAKRIFVNGSVDKPSMVNSPSSGVECLSVICARRRHYISDVITGDNGVFAVILPLLGFRCTEYQAHLPRGRC